jgi:hypothetical protein
MPSHEIHTVRLRLRALTPPDLDELHSPPSSSQAFRRYLLDDDGDSARARRSSSSTPASRPFDAIGYGLWGARRRKATTR